MFVPYVAAALALAGSVLGAKELTLLNETEAGSKITYPPANTTVPLNGTVHLEWEWKEETSPELMVLLVNKNTTIFHAGGHAPAKPGLGGKGLYDFGESVLANSSNTTFGPLGGHGDTSIGAGLGYHFVLAWANKGEDAATNPYIFLQSAAVNVSKKGPDVLPDGVKPYNAKEEKTGGAGPRAAVAAAVVLAAAGAAVLF